MIACFPPTITVIPGESSLTSPIEYRRNQDFYICSIIQFNCDGSLSTITNWTIKTCTTSCSLQIQLDQTTITTLSELYIPPKTLPCGIYEFELTVTMIDTPNLQSSASVYIKILSSTISANLIQLGTSMITNGQEQDLILNPGAFSVDLDGYTFNANVSDNHIHTSYLSFS
jgi:hypothetical protein